MQAAIGAPVSSAGAKSGAPANVELIYQALLLRLADEQNEAASSAVGVPVVSRLHTSLVSPKNCPLLGMRLAVK